MIGVLLIVVPVLAGITAFFVKEQRAVKSWALLSAIVVLAISVYAAITKTSIDYSTSWLPGLNSNFAIHADGMSKMLCLLTGISFPVIFAATYNNDYKNANQFYGLMLLAQAGLMGVFLASDALLFYFFWELALIPVYFLCSIWGGEKRIVVTFKFFIYTFVGSLLMLVGILFLYNKTADSSFAWASFAKVQLSEAHQNFAFWLFFVAFAIKMPIFPLHTWQPDAYEQSPTAVTMVLSGVMVKMGIYAVMRWLVPLFPQAADKYDQIIMIAAVVGMLYASLIAIRQDDIKRLIAYSSIAHIGLMCAAIFAHNASGIQGVLIQMFNHGINVIGLWIVADAVEKQLGTRKMSELGGLAHKAPVLTILLVVLAFANIALPLTNAFIGEFLMFKGLFSFNIWLAAAAAISIILGAVYTLNMVQRVFYGEVNEKTANAKDIDANVKWILALLVVLIIGLGVYAQPMIDLTKDVLTTQLIK